MNNVQKTIFRKYLFLTMLILIFDHLFPGQPFVRCFKFAVVLSLFLTATRIKGKKKREIILHAALFFTVLGDFFLDFCQLTSWFGELIPFGLLCFGVAYLLLISVFYQKSRPGKREKLIFFGVTGSLIFTFFNLFAYFDRRLFLPLIIFG
ncbi:MAG TPA: hypothetical protein GXX38_09305 [Clostridia bacterium]|nr:hypothetical protein [Clostridia bacterium]